MSMRYDMSIYKVIVIAAAGRSKRVVSEKWFLSFIFYDARVGRTIYLAASLSSAGRRIQHKRNHDFRNYEQITRHNICCSRPTSSRSPSVWLDPRRISRRPIPARAFAMVIYIWFMTLHVYTYYMLLYFDSCYSLNR